MPSTFWADATSGDILVNASDAVYYCPDDNDFCPCDCSDNTCSGTTPYEFEVEIQNLVNDVCTTCNDIEGVYTLAFDSNAGTYCVWRFYTASPICASISESLTLRLDNDNLVPPTLQRIHVVFTYELSATSQTHEWREDKAVQDTLWDCESFSNFEVDWDQDDLGGAFARCTVGTPQEVIVNSV